MNVFPGDFYPYSHVHESADAAPSDSSTLTFSSVWLCGGEALSVSDSAAPSLEERGHNRALFSPGGKSMCMCD